MKKLLAVVSALVLLSTAYALGHREGKRHAIHDSVIWTVDVYNPNDPSSSAWGEYDQLIYIEIDNQVYEHGMIQG